MDLNDEIVISGIAGRFPECDSFNEFKDALLNGTDLITVDNRRYPPGTFDTPPRAGKLKEIEYFDAGFFGVSPKQADCMDPRHRIMFETAFEAIVDSGYNPQEVRGSKTGVYAGIGHMDDMTPFMTQVKSDGYSIIGTSLGQVANRTSYIFDFKGPSFVLDTACSSGMYAMVNAVKAMEAGEIDSAIVTAVHLCLHPHQAREFTNLNMLSPAGKCQVFSTKRDGYARSEAIITIFLQKKSQCRRMYSTVLGAKMNCDGWKMEGITFPSTFMQLQMMKDIYKEKNVAPNDIVYVEMHGTGTPVGDIQECQSIYDMFCENRKKPLPVGAVKSNMGHSEISSGLCSVSKVLVAMETGIIPANLHVESIDYELPGIKEGKLEVVTENLPWEGGAVAVNSFGFGGANAHIILKSNPKSKRKTQKRHSHRLVQVSGRTEDSVKYLLDEVEKHQEDEEFLALVDEIHKVNVDGHTYRGYVVLGDKPTRQIDQVTSEKRPIWFVYTGMGCQWKQMGKDLMKMEVFRNTFRKCAAALKPYNIDIESIVLSEDPKTFEDIVNCFAAISATEIALTDVLKSFGIVPDGFVGHSLGEVGCAYANGELTPEQAALIGYARGYATIRSKCLEGQMAAIGLPKEECEKYLPEGVFIGCHNSSTGVTITGPKQPVQMFVAQLNARGIFAKQVETAGYAFHSKYLKDAGPILHDFVAKVIQDPKLRSSKWISSSWPEDEWDKHITKYNSADYHCHNFCSPVLFNQIFQHIPKNAIVVEVAPHGLLQSILKKELGPGVSLMSLVHRQSEDNLQFLLSNIGKIYISGGQPNLSKFYDEGISYPVSRGTPNIGSLIKWDHSTKWFTPFYKKPNALGTNVTVNLGEDKYAYLEGHNIDGRVLMPAIGYLVLVWELLADMHLKAAKDLPIVFENIKLERATVLPPSQDVNFLVNIMKLSGHFEIFEGGSVVCSGRILMPKDVSKEFINPKCPIAVKNGYLPLKTRDVYKDFHLKKYLYEGLFQGIQEVDVRGEQGLLKWNGQFTSFLDSMLQMTLISQTTADLMLPTSIQKLVIDPQRHLEEFCSENKDIPVFYDKDLSLIQAGGIEIVNLESSKAPRRQQLECEPVLESCSFTPYENVCQTEIDLDQSIAVVIQIILENSKERHIKICEISSKSEDGLKKKIEYVLKREPMTSVEFLVFNAKDKKESFDLVIVGNSEENNLDAFESLREDGFVLYQGENNQATSFGMQIVYQNIYNHRGIFLLRKTQEPSSYAVVNVRNSDFAWLEKLKQLLIQNEKDVVYLFSQDDDISGINGLAKCLSLEPSKKTSVKCILIQDLDAERFTVDSEFYRDQLSKNLTYNVLRKGLWGSFRHVPINEMQNIQVEHACNLVQTVGDLSTLNWIERPSRYYKYTPDQELSYVFYAALNFKDIMTTTGKIASSIVRDPTAPDLAMGLEYAGLSKSGKRIMGMVSGMGLGLQVMNDPVFSWEVPNSWSLEDAATVPVVYATCYYALILRGQMQPNESILIHAGTGGIGLAAISIALSMDCTVFTTVGTQDKREFLKKTFPRLKDEYIGNSRDASFEQMIKKKTKGKGVDLVLNSLSADLFQASIRCIAQRGRFLEIGKVDFFAGTPISARLFLKNCSFHGILLDDLFDTTCKAKQDIYDLVLEGICKGVVRPLPRTVFAEDQVEDSFRYLSTGKHKGKVLIKLRNEDLTNLKSPARTISAVPRMYFDPEKSFVLIGGLGGFGLELVGFLIKRNAKKIILNGRRGISNGYQSLCLKRWSEIDGVCVKINNDDTTTLEGAEKLVRFAEKLGPVGGVFNMALVLRDALIENQTEESYEDVFKAKFISGGNMDTVTRKLCPKLEHFVVFSSVACGRGNPGQSNYGMANSALERLCEKRQEEGLPGLAVQWGVVGDVGAVAEGASYDRHMNVGGFSPQGIDSCINSLERFMLQPVAVCASHVLVDKNAELKERSSTKSPLEIIAHIMGIKAVEKIDQNQTLAQLGLDSLMTAEIKQTIYRNNNIELSADEIRDLTFKEIAELTKTSDTKDTESTHINGVDGADNGDSIKLVNAMLKKQMVVDIKNDKSSDKIVFFLHPIEGHIEFMLPLAETLKYNVIGLQCTQDVSFDSMKDYASYFLKQIKGIQKVGPYHLCGYSYGGALAFEIGVQLEKNGDKVQIHFLDGSPVFVRRILEDLFRKSDKSEDKSRFNILKQFASLFDKVNIDEAQKLLSSSSSWEKQLRVLGDLISKETGYSSEDVAVSADRFFTRVHAAYYYEPSGTFKGKVTLVRSKDNLLDFSEDYDLNRICEQKVNVVKLDGNHQQILLEDNMLRIAEIINEA